MQLSDIITDYSIYEFIDAGAIIRYNYESFIQASENIPALEIFPRLVRKYGAFYIINLFFLHIFGYFSLKYISLLNQFTFYGFILHLISLTYVNVIMQTANKKSRDKVYNNNVREIIRQYDSIHDAIKILDKIIKAMIEDDMNNTKTIIENQVTITTNQLNNIKIITENQVAITTNQLDHIKTITENQVTITDNQSNIVKSGKELLAFAKAGIENDQILNAKLKFLRAGQKVLYDDIIEQIEKIKKNQKILFQHFNIPEDLCENSKNNGSLKISDNTLRNKIVDILDKDTGNLKNSEEEHSEEELVELD